MGTGGRIEVQSTEMEIDRVSKPLAVAEAACHPLHALDLRVDRLGSGIRRLVHDRVDDPVQVIALVQLRAVQSLPVRRIRCRIR